MQVYVDALKAVDKQTKIAQKALPELRADLNQALLKGQYESPIGTISFTPEGEIVQKEFYVAQIKMDASGSNGKFAFLK